MTNIPKMGMIIPYIGRLLHGYGHSEHGYDYTLHGYDYTLPWYEYTFLGYYFRPWYDDTLYGLYSIERFRIEGSDAQYNTGGEIAVLRHVGGMAYDIVGMSTGQG